MYSTVHLASPRSRRSCHAPRHSLISKSQHRPSLGGSRIGLAGLLLLAFGMATAPQAPAQLPGETIENAISIGVLPFEDAGNTCEYLNNYDEACPWGSSARDVVYAYAPGSTMTISVDLCGSSYDTKLFVYQDQVTPGHPYACSDDHPTCGYQSRIPELDVAAGHTYYIVVDGYVNECGQYHLIVDEQSSCSIDCPGGGIPEGEESCGYGYVDVYNGGCGSNPPAFYTLNPSDDPIIVCGSTGNWSEGPVVHRDTDWYEIRPEEPCTITMRSVSEWHHQICLIDGRAGCSGMQVLACEYAEPCIEASITHVLEPGIYWLWVGAPAAGGVPCGSLYVLSIEGYVPPIASSVDAAGPGPDGAPPRQPGRDPRTRATIAARPNPFSSATSLNLNLAEASPLHLTIHDVAGRLVRTIHTGVLPAGAHEFTWDGRDESGTRVGTGIFYARLYTEEETATLQLLRMR